MDTFYLGTHACLAVLGNLIQVPDQVFFLLFVQVVLTRIKKYSVPSSGR